MQFETFAPLSAIPGIQHAFSIRDPADATKADDFEGKLLGALGFAKYVRAEQPHGGHAAIVNAPHPASIPGVDALLTRQRQLPLLIRCADCAPVFLVDRQTPAIALIHSGKKGTLANIVGNTLSLMREQFATDPAQCFAFIGPSIGPCHYETDIWSAIEGQLRGAGINQVSNPRICTACHLERYYSYRAELGQTGRMFAVLCLL